MAIMPIGIGEEQPACGCGGCTCGADESKPLETAPASTDV
jgi:hypothetical protein